MNIINSVKKTKFFTLIELIVVIVVIGILAAIVVPNITSMKEEATITAINGNMRNLQTAIDAFQIKNNGTLPSLEEATIGNPQPLDLSQLNPEYIRNLPKIKGLKHWVDYSGTLWVSMADAPTNVKYTDGELMWNASSNSEGYNVFAAEKNQAASSASKKYITLIKGVKGGEINSLENLPALEASQSYYISAIDKNGFETPPVSGEYTGYKNQRPIPLLSFVNEGNLLDNALLELRSGSFVDPDNDEIVEVQWKIDNEEVLSTLPTTPLSVGVHIIEVRIKDEYGLWSEWVSKSITVAASNRKPNAVITVSPNLAIDTDTTLVWSYSNSTDPDGDLIVGSEWENNQSKFTTSGNKLIRLRVQDSKGLWSDWVEKTITVADSPLKWFYLGDSVSDGDINTGQSLLVAPPNKVSSKIITWNKDLSNKEIDMYVTAWAYNMSPLCMDLNVKNANNVTLKNIQVCGTDRNTHYQFVMPSGATKFEFVVNETRGLTWYTDIYEIFVK